MYSSCAQQSIVQQYSAVNAVDEMNPARIAGKM